MPFDGAGPSGNLALQKLDLVAALLASEARWCKRRLRTPDGRRCLRGALRAVEAERLLEPIVLDAIRHVTGRSFWRIESFNDHQATTHALLLQVIDRARERTREGHFAAEKRSSMTSRLRSRARWVAHLVHPA